MEKRKRQNRRKLNNAGMTMVELIVTFALLALFMVAATRVISYVIGIYYAASGNSYGMAVSDTITSKIVGQIEGASSAMEPEITSDGTGIDKLHFIDKTGSEITITATAVNNGSADKKYMDIQYAAVTEGSIKYEPVSWRFDPKAYMGYYVESLRFESPGSDYPENVIKMTLGLCSDRYGTYTSTYYIKCMNVDKMKYE